MAGEETTEKTAATEETKQEEEVKEVVTTETIEQQKTEEVTTEKTEETTEQKTEEKVPIGVQQRINRMYARLQKEREARTTEEQKNKVKDVINNDGEVTEEEEKPLTKDDVDRIIQERERNKEFKSVETEVLVRHPESINEDGTFNLGDPFCAKYIDIGRRNPWLATMKDGPMLAEALAEKELGSSYDKGRTDEANRHTRAGNAETMASTTTKPAATNVKLSDKELHIAKRMNMTPEAYAAEKAKLKR